MDEELIKTPKDRAIAALSRGAAHDFNNILSNIMGFVALAKHEAEQNNAPIARLLDIEDAVARAAEFTQRLASLGKAEPTLKCRTHVAGLVKNVVQTLQCPTGVRLEFECVDDPPQIEAEEGALASAIREVILDSAEACRRGVVRVIVQGASVREHDGLPLSQGEYAKITVKDNGPSPPADDLQGVFDPYCDAGSRGKGIGLALSRSVIREHDGVITMESDGARGVAFHMLFPACAAETPEKTVARPCAPNVLVMDDESIVRELICEVLGEAGYNVTPASDGREAVILYKESLAAGRPFDAVILDLTVPNGMDGRAAIGELMRMDPSVKAIASSGNPADPLMERFSAHGFSAAMAKPYNLAHMTGLLKSLIRDKNP